MGRWIDNQNIVAKLFRFRLGLGRVAPLVELRVGDRGFALGDFEKLLIQTRAVSLVDAADSRGHFAQVSQENRAPLALLLDAQAAAQYIPSLRPTDCTASRSSF